jgi:hypothetical protein
MRGGGGGGGGGDAPTSCNKPCCHQGITHDARYDEHVFYYALDLLPDR